MKAAVVFVFILASCLAFLIMVDLMTGIPFSEAVTILTESFTVVTISEKIIVVVAVTIPFVMPLQSSLKKRYRKQQRTEAAKR